MHAIWTFDGVQLCGAFRWGDWKLVHGNPSAGGKWGCDEVYCGWHTNLLPTKGTHMEGGISERCLAQCKDKRPPETFDGDYCMEGTVP